MAKIILLYLLAVSVDCRYGDVWESLYSIISIIYAVYIERLQSFNSQLF